VSYNNVPNSPVKKRMEKVYLSESRRRRERKESRRGKERGREEREGECVKSPFYTLETHNTRTE
jgi:hypothetical protein